MADIDIITTAKRKTVSAKRSRPTVARFPRKAALLVSKSDIVVKLLARRNGATVAEISGATGWQAHSVRAFFSGLRRKGTPLVGTCRGARGGVC
jgi:hypothetical protein